MKRIIVLATCLALPLAACSSDEDTAAQETVVAQEDAARTTDTADRPETMPEAATPSTSGPAIPANMLGVWDAVTGTCSPASDLRVEIGPQSIQFYESMGTITGIALAENGRTIELAMEGEGETWEQQATLTVDSDTDHLSIQFADAPPGSILIPRKRCPA